MKSDKEQVSAGWLKSFAIIAVVAGVAALVSQFVLMRPTLFPPEVKRDYYESWFWLFTNLMLLLPAVVTAILVFLTFKLIGYSLSAVTAANEAASAATKQADEAEKSRKQTQEDAKRAWAVFLDLVPDRITVEIDEISVYGKNEDKPVPRRLMEKIPFKTSNGTAVEAQVDAQRRYAETEAWFHPSQFTLKIPIRNHGTGVATNVRLSASAVRWSDVTFPLVAAEGPRNKRGAEIVARLLMPTYVDAGFRVEGSLMRPWIAPGQEIVFSIQCKNLPFAQSWERIAIEDVRKTHDAYKNGLEYVSIGRSFPQAIKLTIQAEGLITASADPNAVEKQAGGLSSESEDSKKQNALNRIDSATHHVELTYFILLTAPSISQLVEMDVPHLPYEVVLSSFENASARIDHRPIIEERADAGEIVRDPNGAATYYTADKNLVFGLVGLEDERELNDYIKARTGLHFLPNIWDADKVEQLRAERKKRDVSTAEAWQIIGADPVILALLPNETLNLIQVMLEHLDQKLKDADDVASVT